MNNKKKLSLYKSHKLIRQYVYIFNDIINDKKKKINTLGLINYLSSIGHINYKINMNELNDIINQFCYMFIVECLKTKELFAESILSIFENNNTIMCKRIVSILLNRKVKLYTYEPVRCELSLDQIIVFYTSCAVKDINKLNDFVFTNLDNITCVTEIFLVIIIQFDAFNIYKELVNQCKIIPNLQHLEYACIKGSKKFINFITDRKVIPSHKCFEYLVGTITLSDILKIKFKFNTLITHINECSDNISDMVNLLIDRGMSVDHNDILLLIDERFEINNFDRLDIPVDDDMFEHCIENKFFPKYFSKYQTSNETVILLFRRFKIGNIPSHIRSCIKNVDLNCLVEVCKFKNNKKTIDFILGKKIEIPVDIDMNIFGMYKNYQKLVDYIKKNENI